MVFTHNKVICMLTVIEIERELDCANSFINEYNDNIKRLQELVAKDPIEAAKLISANSRGIKRMQRKQKALEKELKTIDSE